MVRDDRPDRAGPRFTLAVGEHASTGEFTFIRWIATVTDGGETVQFNGCDRIRTRMGLVCENYDTIAAQLRPIA